MMLIRFGTYLRKAIPPLAVFLCLLCLLFWPARISSAEKLSCDEKRLLEAYHDGELIRLHIIANSDTFFDQQVKLKVRDAILAQFGTVLEQKTCEAVYAYWADNINSLQRTAQITASSFGFCGSIKAEAGMFWLPEKNYGKVILPADIYRTIRITLGKGDGQNWWCVLYPQLCLSLLTDADTTAPISYTSRIFKLWLVLPM